jgi:phospholipid transport system substrate-binding protein
VAVLKDDASGSAAKRGRIEQIVYANVDFDTMSRLVLARNWSRFDADEQRRFRDEFKRHLSVTYGRSIDSYKNEEVVLTGDREEARDDWTVKTKIVRGGGDDILVDYRLRQVGGEWKIIDFVVEGVSLVANFRSQFQDMLASKSPSQLIEIIHEKNVQGEEFAKPKA